MINDMIFAQERGKSYIAQQSGKSRHGAAEWKK